MSSEQKFDPILYKETTRQQWQNAATAWYRWTTVLESWLGPATEDMLDLAGVRAGDYVLDVAAGAGGQTLAAARRVGEDGYVLATDISANMLEYATREARQAGLNQVETQVVDVEELDVEAESFDFALSRVGLIYFPNQQKALANIHRALKPGGKVCAIVYSTAENNGFFSIPVSIIRRRAQLPAPLAGQPGPFSLGSPGTLEALYENVGFRDVQISVVSAPLQMISAAECLRFEREAFGALHQMLANVETDGERQLIWDDVKRELEKFETADGFVGPCELIIGIGIK